MYFQVVLYAHDCSCTAPQPSSPEGLQEAVEAEAEAEICLFQQQRREKERIEQEVAEERERLAREREEMGATWGMGKEGLVCLTPQLTHPLTHSLTHSLIHSLTHSLTHSRCVRTSTSIRIGSRPHYTIVYHRNRRSA